MTLEDDVGEEYDKRFDRWYTQRFQDKKIPANLVNAYSKRFHPFSILEFAETNCDPEWVNAFDLRFLSDEIKNFHKKNVDPKIVNAYNSRFQAYEILHFLNDKCLPELVNAFDPRFSCDIIININKLGKSPQLANEFDTRFQGWEVEYLLERDFSPEVANKFDPRFSVWGIDCFGNKISPDIANAYDKRFSSETISSFQNGTKKFSPEEANAFRSEFNGKSVLTFLEAGFSSDKIDEFDKRFSEEDLKILVKQRYRAEIVNVFNQRFSGREIAELINANCTPAESEEYLTEFDGIGISLLYRLKINPSNTSTEEQKKFYDVLSGIINFKRVFEHTDSISFINSGASGVVLAETNLKERQKNRKKNAWKFSKEISKEYVFLKLINDYHRKSLKNVVRTLGAVKDDIVVRLQYIEGQTLDELIRTSQEGIAPAKILSYAYDILNGLIEMKQAGIWYHRDLRPANVIIDRIRDTAVIIDLGIATTDKNALPKDNRRYGGWNDLISLGQIVYHMATGKHIFDQSESQSITLSSRAEQIKDYRNKVYTDPTGKLLQKHLTQVEEDVTNEDIKKLIVSCLKAGNNDHKQIFSMVKKKMNSGKFLFDLDSVIKRDGPLNSKQVISYGAGLMHNLIGMRFAKVWYHGNIRPDSIKINNRSRTFSLDYPAKKYYTHPRTVISYRKSLRNCTHLGNDINSIGQIMYYMATGRHIFPDSIAMNKPFDNIVDSIQDTRNSIYNGYSEESLQYYLDKVDKQIKNKKLTSLIKECLKAKDYHSSKIEGMFIDYMGKKFDESKAAKVFNQSFTGYTQWRTANP